MHLAWYRQLLGNTIFHYGISLVGLIVPWSTLIHTGLYLTSLFLHHQCQSNPMLPHCLALVMQLCWQTKLIRILCVQHHCPVPRANGSLELSHGGNNFWMPWLHMIATGDDALLHIVGAMLPEYRDWMLKDKLVLSWITATIHSSIQSYSLCCEKAWEE